MNYSQVSRHDYCDIAICFDFEDGACRYIHYNKKQNSFEWQNRPDPYLTENKANWIKQNGKWDEVHKKYIDLKNNNTDKNKKSRSLFSEAVSAIYNRHQINEASAQYNYYQFDDDDD